MKTTQPITCIIPTYNGLQLLKKHLPSVLDALNDGDTLIICDDASADQSIAWLKDEFALVKSKNLILPSIPKDYSPIPDPEVNILYNGVFQKNKKSCAITVIHNIDNLRFAAAVNLAVTLVSTSHFVLINSDVSPEINCFKVLRKHVNEKNTFAVGCLEYEHDIQGEKSGKNRVWFHRGLFVHAKADNFESGSTAWASGGSALFSKSMWMELGGFDLAFYPAYWEDIDISYRAHQRGWNVLFDAEAIVLHQHESTNSSVFGLQGIENVSWSNAFKFTWKHANPLQRVLFLLWYPYWHLKRNLADMKD